MAQEALNSYDDLVTASNAILSILLNPLQARRKVRASALGNAFKILPEEVGNRLFFKL